MKVLAKLKGGAKSFHSLKDEAQKVLSCLEGEWAQNVSDPRFSQIVAPPPPPPPLPVIDDGSLKVTFPYVILYRCQHGEENSHD